MISLEWLNDYVDIENIDPKELAVQITKAGVNVEKVITNHIDNLTVGEVIECENHPNSDHLHICKVNVGDKVLQIVCGAPNVRKGLKVIVALEGAILPGNFEIKKGVIRGVESCGMLCALYELGLEEKTEETYNKGICELDSNAKVGEDPLKVLNLDSTLYELDIHKHRNNDCFYHIGFAYEVGAILNKKVKLPSLETNPIEDKIENYFDLKVETNKCPYYLAKMVKDVTIKESPDFIKKRIIDAGMRPINNVVDISNFVMLEYGQPLHFFDKDKLGNKIVVRDACDEEKIVTLDEKERILSNKDIVITDGTKPVAIAGVMGGLNTDIDTNTKNILIESAIFDGVSIRYTSSNLNLKSEASIRYGKGLNYEYTNDAIERACHLLEKYADAKVLTGTVKYDNIDKTPKVVKFKTNDVNKMLGINISNENMEKEFDRLGFNYNLENDTFTVTIPNRRLDIEANVNDIAEEIGRLYGYHNLVGTLPKLETKKGEYKGDLKLRKDVSKHLRGLNLNEVKTYTLVSPEMANLFNYDNKENAVLPNPMSTDKSIVRTTLIPSLINIYEYNKARKVNDILIYEISKTYDKNYNEDVKLSILMKGNYITNDWMNSKIKVDFYLIKGIVENILNYLGFKNRYTFEKDLINHLHTGISASILVDRQKLGIIGRVHPTLLKDEVYVCELSLTKLNKEVKPLKYKESSKYPEIIKDVAFIVPKSLTSGEILETIKKAGGRLLSSIDVFDVYTGENVKENEKSIAYTLTFKDDTRTLNDEEVNAVFRNIIDKVIEKFNVELRDK
ncbi:phenylalanine--tRNA ligase beta subunit [Firmicutes bacterium CAG:884]|nr:phenylalanine--tRNA ligase beta subunit [Firmicutes bacterium CAG:884]